MRKARFSSRSEAGRYAANVRWQGQGKPDESQANVSENVDARPTPGRYKANVLWQETRSLTEPMRFGDKYVDPAVFEKIYIGESKNVKGLTLYKPMIGSKARMVFGEYTSPKGQKFTIYADRSDVVAFDATPNQIPRQFPPIIAHIGVFAPPWADGLEIENSNVDTRFRRQRLGTAMLETIASLNEQSISFSDALSEDGRAWMEGASNTLDKAQFSSRSEAGRYAANIRWQGQGELDRGQANGYDGGRKGEPVKTTRAEVARALRQAGFKASQSVGRGESSGFRTWKFGNQMFLQHAPSTGFVMPNEQIRAKTLEYADALRQAGFEVVDDTIYGDGRVEIIGKTQNVSDNVVTSTSGFRTTDGKLVMTQTAEMPVASLRVGDAIKTLDDPLTQMTVKSIQVTPTDKYSYRSQQVLQGVISNVKMVLKPSKTSGNKLVPDDSRDDLVLEFDYWENDPRTFPKIISVDSIKDFPKT